MVAVPWRRVAAILAVAAAIVAGIVLAVRADGYSAVDATVPRATRWFVDSGAGRAVLADGFSGKTLARLELPSDGTGLKVAQSASGVAVLDRTTSTVRTIDTPALRLGPPQSVSLVAAPDLVVGVGQAGLVAVDPESEQGVVLPPNGDPISFTVGSTGRGDDTRIALDGSVFTLGGGELARVTANSRDVLATGLNDGSITLVGLQPLVLDRDRQRVRFGDGDWVSLPDTVPASELVLQQQGPAADCGWLGADDELWCVDEGGVTEHVVIDGLGIDGADLLSIAGGAGALVRRATSEIVRIDWKAASMIVDDDMPSAPPGAELNMSTSIDLVWIDEVDGQFVWAVNPWGMEVIRKDDASSLIIGEDGEAEQEQGESGTVGSGSGEAVTAEEHEPDNDGIDDPPVAEPDPVTARSGVTAVIAVTANDYDPDGEAIALSGVGDAVHGAVEVGSADTVSYLPEPGFVGVDEFEYTIVDGNGTEASAKVTIELLPADTANQAPVGSPDSSETRPGVPVVIDALLNDIDPERDAIRIDTFTQPDGGGTVSAIVAPSSLPGLQFAPAAGASGRVTFTYRPVDSLGAVGEAVQVVVEVAQPDDANRPPIARPDALRVRRDVAVQLPVLANDRDPDGDRMRIDIVRPTPPGLDVAVRGDAVQIVVRAGAAELSPFQYTVSDGINPPVRGSVLVMLISDVEPNRAPIANADNATAVTGTRRVIDVLANDRDPDNDPILLVSVDQPSGSGTTGSVRMQGDRIEYSAGSLAAGGEQITDRFTYTISDGYGHEARGEVTVRVLPEAIAAPPFASDDSATTEVDVPVTIDVLRNDGDPSGEPPTISGTPGCPGGGSATLTTDQRVTFTPPPGRTGLFSCTYQVSNSQGLLARATIVVSVIPASVTNSPPIVVGEDVAVVVGQVVAVDVLLNDSDPDGPASSLRVLSSSTPTLGRADRVGSTITFTAGPVAGNTTINYQVGDDDGGVTSGQLVIRIVEPDPVAPVAADERRTVTGSLALQIDVVANDSDPDGVNAELVVASVSVDSGSGTATSNGARIVTMSPATSFVGDLVATYTIRDADGLTDTAQVTLTVLPIPNAVPIARDDQADVVSGGSVTVPIALNDEDPNGDPLTYSISTGPDPGLGRARLENNQVVFDSVVGASGVALVEYTVSDGKATARASLRVSVLPCAAAPPNAPDVFLQTGYQQPIFVDLFTYASNGDIVQVGPPLGVPSGVYTPPAGENGNVSFSYVVRNSCRIEDVGQVTIDVNQDPIGAPYVAQIGRTQPFVIPVSALASDAEPLTIVGLEGAPAWVTLVDANRTIQVDPGGRTGRAEFVAVIADPGGLQVRVPVTIDLVNLAPVANPDAVRADAGPVTFKPLANDTDPDGDAIALQSVPATVTFPNGGVATINRLADDSLELVPNGGIGTATFNYSIVDQFGLVSQETTVTVSVNSPPTAADLVLEVPAGSTTVAVVEASDPDGDPLVLTVVDDPAPLTIAVDGRTLTITAPPQGADPLVLRYTVTDPFGASATAFLRITVTEPPTTTISTVPPVSNPPAS